MLELRHMVLPSHTRDTINMLHRAHDNRIFVHPVDAYISGTTVLLDGQKRKVLSVRRVTYTSTGEFMVVTLKPLQKEPEQQRA